MLLCAVYAAWAERYGLTAPRCGPEPALAWLLGPAAWATLADWLGSLAAAFPRETGTDPAAYLDASRVGAAEALRRAGFDAPARIVMRPFGELFPHLAGHAPRPVQQALLDLPLPADPSAPTLTLVEAPTGEGKTEAALALAVRQQDRRGRERDDDPIRGGGLYLALPTQATANGLLQRATDLLVQAHDGPVASFRLAYGRSELHPASEALLADPDALDVLTDLPALWARGDAEARRVLASTIWPAGVVFDGAGFGTSPASPVIALFDSARAENDGRRPRGGSRRPVRYTRVDSNHWPLVPETNALSN